MELKFSDKLSWYTSSKLKCKNAFFTRTGGASVGDTSALNLAFSRGDSNETVLENLSLCAKALGFDAQCVVSCPQVHSTNILHAEDEHKGLGYYKESDKAYDGYVTSREGIVLGVKTADCVPILMSTVINGKAVAIAAVHAGWRGSVGLIADKALKELLSYGGTPRDVFVAIGPCASLCCYEVGDDVYEAALKSVDVETADKYFIKKASNGRYRADLKGFNAAILHKNGVPYENMDVSEMCTICEKRYFYSHRRDGDKRGTHLSVISL